MTKFRVCGWPRASSEGLGLGVGGMLVDPPRFTIQNEGRFQALRKDDCRKAATK